MYCFCHFNSVSPFFFTFLLIIFIHILFSIHVEFCRFYSCKFNFSNHLHVFYDPIRNYVLSFNYEIVINFDRLNFDVMRSEEIKFSSNELGFFLIGGLSIHPTYFRRGLNRILMSFNPVSTSGSVVIKFEYFSSHIWWILE